MTKRLYRSSKSKVLGGVCGGLGEYFEIDPTLIRLFAVIALFFTDGAVFVAYIIGWIIMPLQETEITMNNSSSPQPPPPPKSQPALIDPAWHSFLPGVILIALGGMLLAREYFYWFDMGDFWPVLLIIAGLGLIIFKGTRRNGAGAPINGAAAKGRPTNGQNGGSGL
jgi:phage shock protein C